MTDSELSSPGICRGLKYQRPLLAFGQDNKAAAVKSACGKRAQKEKPKESGPS